MAAEAGAPDGLFAAVETGERLERKEYKRREKRLRTRLLAAQRKARARDLPVLVIIAGVEGAGKGRVVDRLSEWLDTRGVEVWAFWDETDEERDRPRWWRYWRRMPARGEIGVFFGSWYTPALVEHALGRLDDAGLDHQMQRAVEVEGMLARDGAVIVKLWFHLPRAMQVERLEEERARARQQERRVSPFARLLGEHYDASLVSAERAIRLTDTPSAPWHLIEATDHRHSQIEAGHLLLRAIRAALEDRRPEAESRLPPGAVAASTLAQVDLGRALARSEYRVRLRALQERCYGLAWEMRARHRNVVAVFEGWDASGKGGAIRRLTRAIDARLYRTISVGAPTDEELAHHYLWRFWRHVPLRGQMTIYDRSWYGRVLVERVEGLAEEAAWQRAFGEINAFEQQLVDHGTVLLKFWLHISPEEQLKRFRKREKVPWKRHKITAEDWRNRERWDDYAHAVDDMLAYTDTVAAPWMLVPADCKRHARIEVLEVFCDRLERALCAS